MTKDNLVRMIDQTLLKPYATDEQLISFCREGARHGFASVCVSSAAVPVCAPVLQGTATALCAVVGFPLGQTSINVKSAETREAIAGGAGEIDYVINIGKAKGGDWDYVREEMLALTALCHQTGARVKVILETCYLTDEEVRSVCAIAAEVKPDFVKTSTGFGTAGATVHHVRLMSECVAAAGIGVKAAGGIRSLSDAMSMIEAGATRIGTSAGEKLIDGLE